MLVSAKVDSPSRFGLLDPAMAHFPTAPASWYYFGSRAELEHGPCAFELPGGHRFVGFLAGDRTPVVLSARCAHMGADLTHGCVRDGRIVCPLHGWEYGADGRCEHIPVARDTGSSPFFARQTSLPAVERGGHVFFFNTTPPRFPAPFFEGVSPAEIRAARAFDLRDDVPW